MAGNIIVKDYYEGLRWKLFLIFGIIILLNFIFMSGIIGFSLFGIPPLYLIILIGLIAILIIFRKNIFKKKKGSNNISSNHNFFSLKTLIIYGLTFTIGYWISTLVIPFIKTTNLFVIYLLTGLCLELSAKVCQMFLHNKTYLTLDKKFVLWVLIHSVIIYGILYL